MIVYVHLFFLIFLIIFFRSLDFFSILTITLFWLKIFIIIDTLFILTNSVLLQSFLSPQSLFFSLFSYFVTFAFFPLSLVLKKSSIIVATSAEWDETTDKWENASLISICTKMVFAIWAERIFSVIEKKLHVASVIVVFLLVFCRLLSFHFHFEHFNNNYNW